MAQWKKEQEDLKSEKAKRCVYLCGRTGFKIYDIKAHTYICSLHFIGGNGPTAEHPNPINAQVKPLLLTRKGMIHGHMKWISNLMNQRLWVIQIFDSLFEDEGARKPFFQI